jgi:peptidyl-prolyl cis-trans isomerase D
MSTVENPWVLRGIIGILAITFVISLGWWGSEENKEHTVVAEIDEEVISVDEYRRVYKNMSRFYRQMFKDRFDEKRFPKEVIDLMVEERLWIREANRMGVKASDEELRESILKMPGFQKEGVFNAEIYRRVLAAERLTPEKFEEQHRETLLVAKAKKIVSQSAVLTPSEIAEMEAKMILPGDIDQEKEMLLSQKKEKAVRSYILSVKQKSAILIKEELL